MTTKVEAGGETASMDSAGLECWVIDRLALVGEIYPDEERRGAYQMGARHAVQILIARGWLYER